MPPAEGGGMEIKMADEKDSSQNERPKRYLKIDDLNMEFTDVKDIDEYIDLSTKLLASFSSSKPIQANLEIINDDVKEKIKDLESRIAQTMEHVNKLIEEQRALLASLIPSEWKETLDDLLPELQIEVEKEQYHGLSLIDLIYSSYDENGELNDDSLIMQALKEARKHVIKKKTISVKTKKMKSIEYPLDKLNSNTWSRASNWQTDVNVAKRNSGKEINILYAIDFAALNKSETISISAELTAYDKRVYIAVAALFNVGNKIMSTPMIYHAMGFTGEPGKLDKEQIYNSIVKMRLTAIAIDTTKESEVYDYPKFQYTGTLLPSEDYRAIINGNLTDRAINFLREPPLITFAKERGQFTTFEIEVLQSPLSKTDINLKIEDYLLERISSAKHGWQPKILYKTIAEEAGIENMTIDNQRNLKKRLPSKVNKYLDYYIKCQFIKKYTTDKDGVTVFVSKEKHKPQV